MSSETTSARDAQSSDHGRSFASHASGAGEQQRTTGNREWRIDTEGPPMQCACDPHEIRLAVKHECGAMRDAEIARNRSEVALPT
jgi:hypothetical protein